MMENFDPRYLHTPGFDEAMYGEKSLQHDAQDLDGATLQQIYDNTPDGEKRKAIYEHIHGKDTYKDSIFVKGAPKANPDPLEIMTPMLLKSKITKPEIDSISLSDLDALAQIIGIQETQYKEVMKVWRMVRPEIWQRYEMTGLKDTLEQKLLRDALSDLRKAFRKVVRKYGKKDEQQVDGKGDSTDPVISGVQPQ